MRQDIKRYIIGFTFCLLLTLAAYFLVVAVDHPVGQVSMVVLIVLTLLALLQFIVQSIYFLHIGSGSSGRWHSWAFFSMLSVVLIIVIGSIWIMWNLNYNMHHVPSAEEAAERLIEDEGFEHDH